MPLVVGDTVSPYSNLIIRVELISWRSVVDIDGCKKILKKLMETGEGFDRPNEGSCVKGNFFFFFFFKRTFICMA